MEWQEGYVTDVEYVRGVYRELAPSVLNLVLLIQSLEPVAVQDGFTYCDLGCGHGEALNLFAACHPQGQFHGVDFNYAHIAGARGLAGEAGLDNATFWEASFADLATLPLPDFDFVVMHGIYSWVGSDNRRLILDFLERKLKPGGVAYVSYNSLPGWSSHAPLRKLLAEYGDTQTGPLEQRVDRALQFAERLKVAGASVFSSSPSTTEFFERIRTLPRNYLAHEFFNRNWTLFYHSEVVQDLAEAGLSFAGSANFAENQEMLRFTEAQQQVLAEMPDRIMRETVKDFLVSPLLRRDVFTKGSRRMPPSAQMEHFGKLRLALVVPRQTLGGKASFPIGEVLFAPELYDPLLAALDRKPHTLEDLLRRREIARLGTGRVVEALMVLLSAQYLMPAVDPDDLGVMAARKLNEVLLDREADNLETQPVASAVVQNAVKLEWLDRLLVLAKMYGNNDPATSIWDRIQAIRGARLTASPPGPATLDELRLEIESFRNNRLPLLRQLRIV